MIFRFEGVSALSNTGAVAFVPGACIVAVEAVPPGRPRAFFCARKVPA